MAGAIDPHTHIGGGKVTIARMLLPEDHEKDEVAHTAITRAGTGHACPSTLVTGYRYAEMGYTACFEPAMLPANARQAHLEMGDTPLVDKGAFVMLGSDDFLLRLMAGKQDFSLIKDYIGWTMHAAQAIAVKVVNPGGISAFKFNQRKLNLDEKHVYYGVTPRDIIVTLARGLLELGVTHPLHIHGCNLGIPGNVETTLGTIRAADGLPIHLTHIQFHSYGVGGDRHFDSGATRIAELLRQNPNVSIDVGQVLFGATCTASGDSMRQYNGAKNADPKRWVVMDIECDAGCGVVPFRYRDKSYVHSLQWAIGLETFLLCEDPWRIFLTTDHPNGAPFYTYPHLIRLLMDRGFRKDMMQKVHPDALKNSTLPALEREYTLYEVAVMTRAGPARSLGLKDRGHLGVGACADITVYADDADREAMFKTPKLVFKNGELVVRDGRVVKVVQGATHVARPEYDRAIERRLKDYFDRYHTISMENFRLSDEEITEGGRGEIIVQPTRARVS
jgi:formylmethanofuran dehydrogenase subunit A